MLNNSGLQHPVYAFPSIARGHGSRTSETICSTPECQNRLSGMHSARNPLRDWEYEVNAGKLAVGNKRMEEIN